MTESHTPNALAVDRTFDGYEPSYQSFDDRPGLSDSAAKLRAVGLGDLTGAHVLDIGCNEGFFCGAAKEHGAAMVVGMDRAATSVAEARRRFPDCIFVEMSWDDPWEGRVPGLGAFDTVLMFSAIHYATNPEQLIQRIAEAMRPGGVLLLEGGIAEGDTDRVLVERTHDQTWHFTRIGFAHLLRGFVIEAEHPSVPKETDPVPRYILQARLAS
ncbi:MAG: class I SAM-dependent methyltransferase [Actinomycetales bacterium]